MKYPKKSGQALVEFSIGLVGLMVLILAMSYAAVLVKEDSLAILNARMDVGEDLRAGTTRQLATTYYNPAPSYVELNRNIHQNADGAYRQLLDDYPQSAREDGFAFLESGEDPLRDMAGSEKTTSVEVDSPLMRSVLGRSVVKLQHGAWMPPWDDLL